MSVLAEQRTASGTMSRSMSGQRGQCGQRALVESRPVRRSRPDAMRRPPAGLRSAGRRGVAPAACVVPTVPRHRQLVLMIAAGVCAVVVLAGAAIGALADGGAARVPDRTALVTVGQGQSLWDIATEYAPGSDPRAVVERIEELNDLTSGSVPAGYPLSVPVRS